MPRLPRGIIKKSHQQQGTKLMVETIKTAQYMHDIELHFNEKEKGLKKDN